MWVQKKMLRAKQVKRMQNKMDDIIWLKQRTEETDADLLTSLLEDAKSFVLLETNRTYIPEKLAGLPRRIALIDYNRLGTEGEKGRTEGGGSYTFDDLPESVQRQIRSARIARCGGHAFEKKQEDTNIPSPVKSG